ncbi:MAG: aminoglycoside phosphotransferase family protein [Anaerolineales bacterium]|jgi:Ser/Thr protein kinase RdoA (MazF antagonist)
MKIESAFDKPALLAKIRQIYGFPVTSLAFVPEGFVGCHYVAGCEDGKHYFVTLLNESRAARLSLAHLDFTLELTRRLVEQKLFRQLPAPLPTLAGDLKAEFQGQALVLYDYIPGHTLMECYPYPPEILARLGRLTAQLHSLTPQVGMEIPFVEQFCLPFEHDLLEGMSGLEKVTPQDRSGPRILQDLLWPRREMIAGFLARLHDLAARAKGLHPSMVLCHTDITPFNIIQTPEDELFIVDWEGAMLAPAEADVFLFTGEGFPIFLAEYYRESGKPRLDAQLFAFYMFRRSLVDLTDWIVTILHENTSDEQDQNDLKGLLEDCISTWPHFDTAIELVREQLKAVTA